MGVIVRHNLSRSPLAHRQVPHVQNAEEAKEAVRNAKFPPLASCTVHRRIELTSRVNDLSVDP